MSSLSARVLQMLHCPDDRRGQTMIEYVIAAGIILTVIVSLSFLLYALKQNGNRVLDLVASEYP